METQRPRRGLIRPRRRGDLAGGTVGRHVESRVDSMVMGLFVLFFGGAGGAVGFMCFHPQLLKTYWYVLVIALAAAVGGCFLLVRSVKKATRRSEGSQWVKWLVVVLATFAVGVLIGSRIQP